MLKPSTASLPATRPHGTTFYTTRPMQISSSSGFINTWLVGYSALLGPVIGVVMADYWLVRRCKLDVDSLYTKGEKSLYWYKVRGASECTCRFTDKVDLKCVVVLRQRHG